MAWANYSLVLHQSKAAFLGGPAVRVNDLVNLRNRPFPSSVEKNDTTILKKDNVWESHHELKCATWTHDGSRLWLLLFLFIHTTHLPSWVDQNSEDTYAVFECISSVLRKEVEHLCVGDTGLDTKGACTLNVKSLLSSSSQFKSTTVQFHAGFRGATLP